MTFHLNNPMKKITDKVFKFRILAASLNINFNQHVNHSEGKLLIKIMQNVCEIYVSDKFKIISICNNKKRACISLVLNRMVVPSSAFETFSGYWLTVDGKFPLKFLEAEMA